MCGFVRFVDNIERFRSHLSASRDPGQRGRARHGLGHARSGQPAHALTRRAGVAGCAQRAALLARAPPVPLGAHYCDVYVTALTFGIVAPGALPRQQDLWRRRRMRGAVRGGLPRRRHQRGRARGVLHVLSCSAGQGHSCTVRAYLALWAF